MKNFEKRFNQFLTSVSFLQNALNVSFSEALTETFDNLESNKIKVEMGAPNKEEVAELSEMYQALDYDNLSKKEKVTIFNYLVLKALNDEKKNSNQMPTPTIIATIIALLMKHLLPDKKLTIADPAIGTGNLLYSTIDQIISNNHPNNPFQLVGIDNDEEMINFSDIGAHLYDFKIELYCQDAIMPWLSAPDAVISDLPVGYYPLDNNAANFELKAESGHSYAHFLFIEQIIKNLKPAGYAFLVVPKMIISGSESEQFMSWLNKKVYLNAIINLPDEMFKNKFNQKVILVFQNHGENAASKDVLLTKLASLREEDALVSFNIKLNEWYTSSSN